MAFKMDPLTVVATVASIGQLAQAALSLSKVLYAVGSAVASASDDIQALADDLKTFSQSLTLLSRLLEDSKSWYSDDVYLLTAKIIKDCADLYAKIDKVLGKLTRNGKSNWRMRVKFVYKEGEIRKLMKRLRDMKGTLATILMSLQVDLQLSLLNISSSSKLQRDAEKPLHPETIECLKQAQKAVEAGGILPKYTAHEGQDDLCSEIPLDAPSFECEKGIPDKDSHLQTAALRSSDHSTQDTQELPDWALLSSTSSQQFSWFMASPPGHIMPPALSLTVQPDSTARDKSTNLPRNIDTLERCIDGEKIRTAATIDNHSTSRSLKSASSSESFKSAMSIQQDYKDVSHTVRAVQSLTHGFRIAVETLNNLIEKRLRGGVWTQIDAAERLQESLEDARDHIEDLYNYHCKLYGAAYIKSLTGYYTELQELISSVMQEIATVLHIYSAQNEELQGSKFDTLYRLSRSYRKRIISLLKDAARLAGEIDPKGKLSSDAGNRRKVAKALTTMNNYLGTAAHDRFDDSEFKRGKAVDFPEIPGEERRNRALPQIREQYNQYQDTDGNVTPVLREQPSRAGRFTDSVASGLGVEGSSTTPRSASPQSPQSPHSPSPFPSPTTPRRPHASTLPAERTRDTLKVPSPVHHSPNITVEAMLVSSPATQHNFPGLPDPKPLPFNGPRLGGQAILFPTLKIKDAGSSAKVSMTEQTNSVDDHLQRTPQKEMAVISFRGPSNEEDDIDKSAIDEDDDSSVWEDSIEESGNASLGEDLFKRVDSRPNLTSRRSLITTTLHQSDKANAVANTAPDMSLPFIGYTFKGFETNFARGDTPSLGYGTPSAPPSQSGYAIPGSSYSFHQYARLPNNQPRKKAVRAAYACDYCRTLKAKCDEGNPSCGSCKEKGVDCRYRDTPVASKPSISAVGNYNGSTPPPEPKRFTAEELKQQYGIHLTTRLQSDDPGKYATLTDIDDDDDDQLLPSDMLNDEASEGVIFNLEKQEVPYNDSVPDRRPASSPEAPRATMSPEMMIEMPYKKFRNPPLDFSSRVGYPRSYTLSDSERASNLQNAYPYSAYGVYDNNLHEPPESPEMKERCVECGIQFYDLKTHMLTHESERPEDRATNLMSSETATRAEVPAPIIVQEPQNDLMDRTNQILAKKQALQEPKERRDARTRGAGPKFAEPGSSSGGHSGQGVAPVMRTSKALEEYISAQMAVEKPAESGDWWTHGRQDDQGSICDPVATSPFQPSGSAKQPSNAASGALATTSKVTGFGSGVENSLEVAAETPVPQPTTLDPRSSSVDHAEEDTGFSRDPNIISSKIVGSNPSKTNSDPQLDNRTALEVYEAQLMLLEQENKKRLMKARREADLQSHQQQSGRIEAPMALRTQQQAQLQAQMKAQQAQQQANLQMQAVNRASISRADTSVSDENTNSNSFPSGNDIWNNGLRKEPPSRLMEVLSPPKLTSHNDYEDVPKDFEKAKEDEQVLQEYQKQLLELEDAEPKKSEILPSGTKVVPNCDCPSHPPLGSPEHKKALQDYQMSLMILVCGGKNSPGRRKMFPEKPDQNGNFELNSEGQIMFPVFRTSNSKATETAADPENTENSGNIQDGKGAQISTPGEQFQENKDEMKKDAGHESKEGTSEPSQYFDLPEMQPLYVNQKQFHRILKRRVARQKFEQRLQSAAASAKAHDSPLTVNQISQQEDCLKKNDDPFINEGSKCPCPYLRTDNADVLPDFDFDSFLSEGNKKVADFHFEPLDPESEIPAINRGLPPPAETPIGAQTKTDVEKHTNTHHQVQEVSNNDQTLNFSGSGNMSCWEPPLGPDGLYVENVVRPTSARMDESKLPHFFEEMQDANDKAPVTKAEVPPLKASPTHSQAMSDMSMYSINPPMFHTQSLTTHTPTTIWEHAFQHLFKTQSPIYFTLVQILEKCLPASGAAFSAYSATPRFCNSLSDIVKVLSVSPLYAIANINNELRDVVEIRENVIKIVRTVDEQLGLGIATLGWSCVLGFLEIYDKLLTHPLPFNSSALNQTIKTSYTQLLDITAIIARYAVMENLYQQSHGTLSLTPEYQESLIHLCKRILTYFARAFQIGRWPAEEDVWYAVDLWKGGRSGIWDSLVEEIKRRDGECQGFRVVVESKEDSESENKEAEIEELSDSDDSWERINGSEVGNGIDGE